MSLPISAFSANSSTRIGSLQHLKGVPLATISKRLGHTKLSMTLDRYISDLPGMQEAATKALDEVFG